MLRCWFSTGLFLICAAAVAQTPYPLSPDWTSTDTEVSTGGALVDLDRDGWLDLVIANGNDMAVQSLVVYYNNGDGTLPLMPGYSSTDVAYNGHLDVADVNGDGWPDVAVAVLGAGDDIAPVVKLYLNNSGTLSSTPDWQADEIGNAFGCAFGDVNNDGRPDLAVATGWAYSPANFYPNYVYINSNGSLPSAASWASDDVYHLQGVQWVDANSDGWLDLVGAASLFDTVIYTNTGGMLETSSSWKTIDATFQDAIMVASGDLNRDGYRDLLITDNIQLGGSGRLRQYNGLALGYFETRRDWTYYVGQGSAVAVGDIDGDGALDAVSGGWWENLDLFFNEGNGLPSTPDWTSTLSTVVEKIVLADIDNDGLSLDQDDFAASATRFYYLDRQAIHAIVFVKLDGVELSADQYTFDLEEGWVSIASAPATSLVVRYSYSRDLDMAVSNWDNDVGNHLYYNTGESWIFVDGFELGDTGAWSSVFQ